MQITIDRKKIETAIFFIDIIILCLLCIIDIVLGIECFLYGVATVIGITFLLFTIIRMIEKRNK